MERNNPKVIAFYLPQFHRIPENDEWWGENFTEWVSVKGAAPLFPHHDQPRVPLNENYYNLLDKKTMKWQAELAKKARIYGFCIYHYWFGDKQLLEKPAENLLKWKDIDINYCFSWANESWVASWSKLLGNQWNGRQDKPEKIKNAEKKQQYLAQQQYGDQDAWKEHFEYLLPFFKDERYIKMANKPVMVLYRPFDFRKMPKMMAYWNELARNEGFDGVYFIGTNCFQYRVNYSVKKLDAMLLYEPSYTLHNHEERESKVFLKVWEMQKKLKSIGIKIPRFVCYSSIWRRILSRKCGNDTYYGGFVNFDDSPRRGSDSTIFLGVSPEKFKKYFQELYHKSVEEKKEFIFLTAWNEWGEGSYMEPDSKYGHRYLQAIRDIVKQN